MKTRERVTSKYVESLVKIKTENFKGNARLRFTYKGVRYSVSVGLKYEPANYVEIEKVCNKIRYDIDENRFDTSLNRYKLKKTKKEKVYTLDIWKEWILTLNLSDRTYQNHYRLVEKALIRDNPTVNHLVEWWLVYADKYASSTYNQRLSYLQSCIKWAYEESLIDTNPIKHLKRRTNLKKKVIPFTKEEYLSIVEAFRKNTFCSKKSAYKHSFYADYIDFLFKTGFRPSEAIGLRVKDINFSHSIISIDTVLARGDRGQSTSKSRVRKSTKTGDIRSIKATEAVLCILRRRILEYELENEDLIFFNHSGNAIDDRIVSQRYWKPVLKGLGLDHRKIYATKHTLATLALKEMTPSMVAKLLGHVDARMIYEHYGNIIDTPNLPDL